MLNEPQESGQTYGVDNRLMRNGGLSYLEIPAVDARHSARFYESVLGWTVEERSEGDYRFTDSTGHMIGRWVQNRMICDGLGLLPYIYVDGIDGAAERAVAGGGHVVEGPRSDGNLWVATIRDPAGNAIGLWQAGPR